MAAMNVVTGGFEGARVLLLSAHTDDCELGMGATISRLVREGANIQWHVFSNAVDSLPEGFPQDTLIEEQRAAVDIYGISQNNIVFHDFPVRRFPEFRQPLLETLVRIRREFCPDLVFCAARTDCHQDHSTLTNEAFRAFKGGSILGYQLPWNSRLDERQLAIEVSQDDMQKRKLALDSYRSQAHRPYFRRLSGGLALDFYGCIAGFELAEVFQVISISVPLTSIEA